MRDEASVHRHFAIVLALSRHALYAAAALPDGHAQRGSIRHQVGRLYTELKHEGETERADKIGRLLDWYDTGAQPSGDIAVLSETQQ